MLQFEEIVRKVQISRPGDDLSLLRKAYEFSASEHKTQTRISGEPFVSHPLAVANVLADMKLDVVCLVAGMLHDVVEDTPTTVDRISQEFGPDVARIVEGVTKISRIEFVSPEVQQAENLRKMVLAMVDDIRVVLVKLADRLHNMRTLEHLPPEKRERIARETIEIYAPIAHRLGMGKIRGELEDLAFRHLEPQAFEDVKKAVESRRKVSEEFLEEVRALVDAKLKEHSIPARIDGRIKRLFSIWQKLKRQQISIDQVYDLLAIRILTDSVKNVPTCTSRCTLPSSDLTASLSRCRSAPRRCTAWPRRGLRRTGNIRTAGPWPSRTRSASRGCATWWNGSRRCATRANFSPPSASTSIPKRPTPSHPRAR